MQENKNSRSERTESAVEYINYARDMLGEDYPSVTEELLWISEMLESEIDVAESEN